MDSEPLLSTKSPFPKNHTIYSSLPSTSTPLCPLPEHQEITIPPVAQSSSSSPSSPDHADSSWLLSKPNLHRSRTAPAISVILSAFSPSSSTTSSPLSRPSIVRTSVLLLSLYLCLGVAIYTFFSNNFSAFPTHPVIDALYFCIVTMCTIGYGDITPATPFAKLFSIMFVLFGFGFIDILLSSMVTYVLDLQESLLLASIGKGRKSRTNYLVDVKKGRMRIRMKVGLALAVVFLCIGVGTAMLRFVEKMDWLDSFYLSVMSVTTVGYGDRAFKTMTGRLFASIWLLISTLAVARAFLYLAEARIDKRHRKMAKYVLSRDMTVSEFLAADIDNNGFVSKSEFVIYKLKEMGKITEKDILQICDQFEKLDTSSCGKITLSDIAEAHNHS